jgi:hypothetical protein
MSRTTHVYAVAMFLACFSLSSWAAALTVCNKLPEKLSGLQFLGAASPDPAAQTGMLAPGACAKWDKIANGSYPVHYILGESQKVMLCSIMVTIPDSAKLEISENSHASCMR